MAAWLTISGLRVAEGGESHGSCMTARVAGSHEEIRLLGANVLKGEKACIGHMESLES